MAAVLLAALLIPVGAASQGGSPRAPLSLTVDPVDGALTVRIGTLLEGGDLEDALLSGLPLRIHVVAELWKDRFFDSQEGRSEWRASVVYDPLSRRYQIQTSDSTVRTSGETWTVPSLDAVRRALQQSVSVPLRPGSEGRFYYMASIEVQTLSLTDLEELQRWLQGELAPAVSGEGDVEGAMGRGVRRLMVRMLGLPVRRFRTRTEPFDFDPG